MRKFPAAIVFAFVAVFAFQFTSLLFAASKETLITFENIGADVDDAPSGFTAAVTGGGEPDGWKVQSGDAPSEGTGGQKHLVRKSTDKSENRAPVCVLDEVSARDVDVTVFIKVLGGTFEQSAGVIVRYQDVNNYYVLRANAKVGNVALLKITNGAFEKVADRSTAVTLKKWQKLRLVVKGNSFEAFLDSISLFKVDDATIDGAGKVGVWTRSDSEARFDDLRIVKND